MFFYAVFADSCENSSFCYGRKEHASNTPGAVQKRPNVNDPLCGPQGNNEVF